MELLDVGADLRVVALELLVHVEEALRDARLAPVAPGTGLVVTDEVMRAAEDVVVLFFMDLMAGAGLFLSFRKLLHAVSALEDEVLGCERATLGLDVQVTEIAPAGMDLKHVPSVLITIIEVNVWAKLALVAAALIAFSVKSVEIPVLEVPFSLFRLRLLGVLLLKLLVLLDDLVEEVDF